PVQAWRRQETDLAEKRAQLAVLAEVNVQLAADNARTQTVEGAKEAARTELGFIEPGEQRLSVMPGTNAPVTLPGGWPYDTIGQIVSARAAAAQEAAAQQAAAQEAAAQE